MFSCSKSQRRLQARLGTAEYSDSSRVNPGATEYRSKLLDHYPVAFPRLIRQGNRDFHPAVWRSTGAGLLLLRSLAKEHAASRFLFDGESSPGHKENLPILAVNDLAINSVS